MHAMHYEITLPADYDMEIIRERVKTNAPGMDFFDGLGLKAYLIRERGVDGSRVNQYAPFYLWNSPARMNRFLWDGGFGRIVESFGRPVVQHWLGLAFRRGPDFDAEPVTATKRVTAVPPEDPAAAVHLAANRLQVERGVHSTALAVDPRTWELVHFTLWSADAEPDGTARYQVLYLNTPELAELRPGRQW
jgi:hypothetical protein